MPAGVASGGLNDLSFLVQAASLPGSVIQPVPVYYYGRPINVAGDREFQPWTVSVLNREDFDIRNMLESWHNKINALVSNRQDSPVTDLVDYKIEAEVLQFGKSGPGDRSGAIRSYVFSGLWPISIDPIDVDWRQANQVESFNVTFAYDYWIPGTFGRSQNQFSPTLAPDPSAG